VIDLHAHLLPGLDDGPRDLEGALKMARAAVAAGTTTMAATPHIDHAMGVDPRGVRPAVAELREALAEAGIPLEVVPGGEVALTRLTELSDEDLEAVCLGDSRWILLECPLDPTGGPMEEATFSLQVRGFDVLLAHPERSPQFLRQPDRLRGLVDQGARTSVTASALGGTFGRTAQSVALRFLQEGLVHSLASDAHDHRRRPPEIAAGVAAAEQKLPGTARLATWLTEEVPGAIVAGASIPAPPEVEFRRGLLQRLGLRRA
jgi:protein-tyrosine phosphatase